jgi:hypothetical protein
MKFRDYFFILVIATEALYVDEVSRLFIQISV